MKNGFWAVCMAIALSVLGGPAAQAQASEASFIALGKKVYAQWCVACHGPGQHTPGTMALHFKYGADQSPLLEERAGMNADFLRVFVRNGISVMPSFRRTEISDRELDALATYLQHTSGKVVIKK